MKKKEFIFQLILINILNILDVFTTIQVLKMGMVEVNPFMKLLFDNGFRNFANLFKIGIIFYMTYHLYYMFTYPKDNHSWIFGLTSTIMLILISIVVFNNTLNIIYLGILL